MTPEELVISALDYLDFDARLGLVLSQGDDSGYPPGIRAYFGTESVDEEPSFTFAQRASRCYEMAGVALITHDFPEEVQLVHGTIHGPEDDMVRMGHGWLLLGDDLLWEPTRAMIHPRPDWYTYSRARDERTYTVYQARQQMVIHGHYGRWHESEYR